MQPYKFSNMAHHSKELPLQRLVIPKVRVKVRASFRVRVRFSNTIWNGGLSEWQT